MKIEPKEILIKDVVSGYINNNEEGVVGYGGQLNIRPKYQREFVYKDKQRNAVIKTIRSNFPLNTMYWAVNEDTSCEVLDGQQRIISICEYVDGKFSIDYQYFHNLEEEEKEQILNYKLMVYLCSGTDKEKLNWFKTINIANEILSEQELKNAVYTGPWLTDAKRYFSKSGCVAGDIGSKYLKGVLIRQKYLETAINWISKGNIEQYMADNQPTQNATELWLYFQSVINWVEATFPEYRNMMKGIKWGSLYSEFKGIQIDSVEIEEEIKKLMEDDDVTKPSGIYQYVLTRDEKYLSIRSFSSKQKTKAYEKQKGICVKCDKYFEENKMEGDHIEPWSSGGKTVPENLQMLCKPCNGIKSNK